VDFNKPTSRATAADRRGVPAADADRWYVGRQVREDKAPFGQPLLLEIHSLDLSASYALTDRWTVAATVPFSRDAFAVLRRRPQASRQRGWARRCERRRQRLAVRSREPLVTLKQAHRPSRRERVVRYGREIAERTQ